MLDARTCSCNVIVVLVMLYVVVLVTHTLLDLQYANRLGKTAAAKELAQQLIVSVGEAESAEMLIIPKMNSQGGNLAVSRHPYILQWMFAHAEAIG